MAKHHRPGCERLEAQGLEVERSFHFRVFGEKNLEAAVDPETIDHVRADAAARAVRGFKQSDFPPRLLQKVRGAKSCESSADHNDAFRHPS